MSESLNTLSVKLEDIVSSIQDIEEAGEIVPKALIEQLETALTVQAEKVDRCAMFISRAGSEMDWLDNEIKLLQAQKKRIQNGVERVKELARYVMNRERVTELTGLRGHKFSLRASQSVMVLDESQVPREFIREKTTTEVNKADALKALKDGVEIPGLLLQKNENVVVK